MKTTTFIWLFALTIFVLGLAAVHHTRLSRHQRALESASEVFHSQLAVNKDVFTILVAQQLSIDLLLHARENKEEGPIQGGDFILLEWNERLGCLQAQKD